MISASRSVRLGTVDEVYEYDASFQRVFSPLLPQTAHNIEGSLVYEQNKNRIAATVYEQKLKNEILFNPTTFTNDNVDPTKRNGITLAGSTEIIESILLNASFTRQQAEFRSGINAGKIVPVVPDYLAYMGFNWQISSMFALALSDTYTGSKYFDNDTANSFGQKIPNYHRIDVRAGFTRQYLNAGFSVYNLADGDDHFDYGVRSSTLGRYTAYPLPGREYRFDIGIKF
jgi:iron complex outermembrane receptor protein